MLIVYLFEILLFIDYMLIELIFGVKYLDMKFTEKLCPGRFWNY